MVDSFIGSMKKKKYFFKNILSVCAIDLANLAEHTREIMCCSAPARANAKMVCSLYQPGTGEER
jgi:hypothetical protein